MLSPYQTVSSNKIKGVIFYYYNKQNVCFPKLPIGTYFLLYSKLFKLCLNNKNMNMQKHLHLVSFSLLFMYVECNNNTYFREVMWAFINQYFIRFSRFLNAKVYACIQCVYIYAHTYIANYYVNVLLWLVCIFLHSLLPLIKILF